ncbi:hypothetical protein J7T55_011166 [Diaporthe amygdali]|uniref:uncharacterized protein n=1 Tax=Phomopsis amygdali TaxID=1214568 RepID=UPI0022FE124E|nr:uncharacterized protein J7T55_011166 [Diaporthe amygdali]KAJ0104381.1 hypothetical protein J7T55_011166 [Diaporthe amygdali]
MAIRITKIAVRSYCRSTRPVGQATAVNTAEAAIAAMIRAAYALMGQYAWTPKATTASLRPVKFACNGLAHLQFLGSSEVGSPGLMSRLAVRLEPHTNAGPPCVSGYGLSFSGGFTVRRSAKRELMPSGG